MLPCTRLTFAAKLGHHNQGHNQGVFASLVPIVESNDSAAFAVFIPSFQQFILFKAAQLGVFVPELCMGMTTRTVD